MKIDIVSDVSCPWCAVGLHALEQALARFDPPLVVELHFQPFELNPAMGPDGEDIDAHLAAKYGLPPDRLAANREALRQRGEAVGFRFTRGARNRIYNTFDAHRLLHWAGLEGGDRQLRLKHALLRAYFTDGENPSDRAVLLRLAVETGLDAAHAQAVLAGTAYAAEVREREKWYLDQGIHSVPAVIINDRHLISGGQPPEVFEQALRQLAAA